MPLVPKTILLGGFLGAGKTTAALELARSLTARGLRPALVSNDQSVGLVDTERLRASMTEVREITGGCFCCRLEDLLATIDALVREDEPDVIIAEAVGSCTDLRATVAYPLREIFGAASIAPLSVVIDPVRLVELFGAIDPLRASVPSCLRASPSRPPSVPSSLHPFSDEVAYIYERQLAEADILVLNKCDRLEPDRIAELTERLRSRYPAAEVMTTSCTSGDGLNGWFARVLDGSIAMTATMDVDYDRYADGESRLGWLNASATLEAPAGIDADGFAEELVIELRDRLRRAGIAIAHLKLALSPRDGGDAATVSVSHELDEPMATRVITRTLVHGRLLVNLRAETDPEILRAITEGVLANRAGVRIATEHVAAFRPGRPVPTRRVSSLESRVSSLE